MLVKRNGIFKTIQSSEYGLYLEKGFIKVVDDSTAESKVEVYPEPKLEPEPIKEEPVVEIEEQPIKEVEQEEIVIPKSKKRK